MSKKVKLTPLTAIRKICLDCQETTTDIRSCLFDECSLYPFRMGKGRVKLKDIRAYCRWCCLDKDNEIKLCPSNNCPLWIYRNGHNPTKETTQQYLSGKPLVSKHKETNGDDSGEGEGQ